jgi:hypothetical protein
MVPKELQETITDGECGVENAGRFGGLCSRADWAVFEKGGAQEDDQPIIWS